jgi:MoxR-like ATPase
MKRDDLIFENDPTRRPSDAHGDSPKMSEPYVIEDAELKRAINLAIYLQRPLLLEGEAGCGKTCLATAIAYELGLPLYRWNIRSTSKAREGLYEYDALLRLHDVQVQAVDPSGREPSQPENYVRYGALGKAFQLGECPGVVLIDEIDKADLDFPNDLLTVLDKPWTFEIPEAGRKNPDTGKIENKVVMATHPPIVIITSNREKFSLPKPFLRRCVYYYMQFPSQTSLKAIAQQHFGASSEQVQLTESSPLALDLGLVDAAIARLEQLRNGERQLEKKPGTSEFLDWVKAMHRFGEVSNLIGQLKVDAKSDRVPFREVLFKVQRDWQNFKDVGQPSS